MHNDLTFFTNEPDRDLYSRFNKILQSNTQFFDVLVGYFRTSGFFKLYPAMKDVEKIRILVGLNVDSYTVKIIDMANEQIEFESQSTKEAIDNYSKSVEQEFEKSEDTENIEFGVRTFIEWLKNDKLELRMYTEAPIHAKVYIMRKDPVKVPDTYGSIITGSSNFSKAGLQNNLEFNVELKDSRDVEFALDRFEALWVKSVDIKDTFVDTINEKTWLKGDITPYEMYLKTIYEFFKEEVNSDKDTTAESLLPPGYMRLQYQLDAVTSARKILEAYGGVFLSDVVGLGKTYIAAMLAKSLSRASYKLIVCPPVLVDYWKSVLDEFEVSRFDVMSLGKLNQLVEKQEKLNKYDYVFIDEVHRFRNSDTENYSLLHQICKGKKVILISATPVNNYSTDIQNQIYLFQDKHNSTIIPNIKNLDAFFVKLNKELKKAPKGTERYYEILKHNAETIRDQVLRVIMIRRTRSEIKELYSDDLSSQGLVFPKLGSPEKVVYTFDGPTDRVFKETMNAIKILDYSRYSPLLFLKDNKKYATMIVAQHNMSGFMKSILVKRLESSFYSFRMTLDRFITSYEQFIAMYKTGKIYISKTVNVYDLLDSGDDAKLLRLVDEDRAQMFTSDEFTKLFLPSLERDLAILLTLKDNWEDIKTDPKLDEFLMQLKENSLLINKKIIIFSESKETVEYLHHNLSSLYGDRVVKFSGDSSESLKNEIEDSFNPKNEDGSKTDRFDVLITTDVLAEGINLHKANVLINYDLPWNPTKIMQRCGRINRVGSKHDRIFVFNFFPTSQSDKALSLEDKILSKLQLFHDTLGEDYKYLSENEQVGSHGLYGELNKNLDDKEDTINPELYYLKLIREIRDKETPLFNKITKLPLKSKTGKFSEAIAQESTITFMRQGSLKKFFITENNTIELSFLQAIDYINSTIDDKRINVSSKYFSDLEANKQAFNDSLLEEIEVSSGNVKLTGNDAKIVKTLRAILSCRKFTDDEEKEIKNMIDLWQNGSIPSKITKDILRDIKKIEDPISIYHEITDRIPDRYLITSSSNGSTTKKHTREVILSMYMSNGGND